jgi:membrane-associated phospholipid phosphatase
VEWPQGDTDLFLLLHREWVASWLDATLPLYREKSTWIPLYLVLAFLLIRHYGRRGVLVILLSASAVGLSDSLSASVLKPAIQRDRPCRETSLQEKIRPLLPCGRGYSFPSAHAANHSALAVFWWLLFRRRHRMATALGLLWAVSIGYAQIYTGLHYPLDVAAGFMLGSACAWLCWRVLRWLRPGWTRALR